MKYNLNHQLIFVKIFTNINFVKKKMEISESLAKIIAKA